MKYEYKIVRHPTLMEEKTMNAMGEDGYRLVAIFYDKDETGWFYYYFVREIKNG